LPTLQAVFFTSGLVAESQKEFFQDQQKTLYSKSKVMANRSWHIVGTGSIGSFCGANIIKRDSEVRFIAREPGKTWTFTENNFHLSLGPAISAMQSGPIDNLLLPTKAYDVLPALNILKPKLAPGANIVLCHNGMGTIDDVRKILSNDVNLYFCTTSNGAFRDNNSVVLAGTGQSFWQAISIGDESRQLVNKDFEDLFRQSEPTTDLQELLWRKLLINCAINPLTALERVENGALADEQYRSVIQNIVAEVVAVANAHKVVLQFQTCVNIVLEVIQKTAKNTSSMRQDVINNRRTEIDFINGYVVKLAQQAGIPVPENQRLWHSIKALER